MPLKIHARLQRDVKQTRARTRWRERVWRSDAIEENSEMGVKNSLYQQTK